MEPLSMHKINNLEALNRFPTETVIIPSQKNIITFQVLLFQANSREATLSMILNVHKSDQRLSIPMHSPALVTIY